MEALYLLCSIIYTSITTLILSLFLPFRYLLSLLTTSRGGGDYISFYQGTVHHERRSPVHHSFTYSVRYALINLDNSPPRSLISNHLTAHEARQYSQTNGPILLLTIPPSVGYEQNPVSFYYCYDVVEGSNSTLKKCIAEVNNTPWNERLTFVFDPFNDDEVAKSLHVSPFMDMLGNWRMKTIVPGDNVCVTVSVQHPKLGNYMTATLKAKKVSSHMVVDHALFFWLIPQKVVFGIYWQALKLWLKGVPYLPHPRQSNPNNYREEATQRDIKLSGCPIFGAGKENNLQVGGNTSNLGAGTNAVGHNYRWREAFWPWG